MRVTGEWFRHHDAGVPPDRPTTRGWRWNPEGLPTLYLASSVEGCRRELVRLLERASLRPGEVLPRALSRFKVRLREVEPLRSDAELKAHGLSRDDAEAPAFDSTQEVARRIAERGSEGLVARSAVDVGSTLAAFVDNVRAPSRIDLLDTVSRRRLDRWS